MEHEIDFLQLFVNTNTSVHNLSFSTKKYRPGTLVLVKQAFFIINKPKIVTEKKLFRQKILRKFDAR